MDSKQRYRVYSSKSLGAYVPSVDFNIPEDSKEYVEDLMKDFIQKTLEGPGFFEVFEYISQYKELYGDFSSLRSSDYDDNTLTLIAFQESQNICSMSKLGDMGYEESFLLLILKKFADYILRSKRTEDIKYKILYFSIGELFLRLLFHNICFIAIYDHVDYNTSYYLNTIRYPEFATFIKTLRSLRFREAVSEEISYLPAMRAKLEKFNFDIDMVVEMDGYDRIICEDYLIRWEEEAEKFEHCLTYVPLEDEEIYRNHTKKILNECYVLEENSLEPTWYEILSRVSSSKNLSFGDIKKTSSRRVALRQNTDLIKSKKYLECPHIYKRIVVNVSPANSRDAWMPDIATYASNYYFDTIASKIIFHHPRNAMGDISAYKKRLSNFIKSESSWFIMKDIKSSQLDFSHDCLKILCEELELFSGFPFRILYRKVKNQVVYKDGDAYYPRRGTGLGMLNHIYCLHTMILSDILGRDSLNFNDDVVEIIRGEGIKQENLSSILRFDERLYKALATTLQLDKLIVSKGFVFLEEYHRFENEGYDFIDGKVQKLYQIFASIILLGSTREKKMTLAALANDERIGDELFKVMTERILMLSPPEFPEIGDMERLLPTSVGGWPADRFTYGVDDTLVRYEKIYNLDYKLCEILMENHRKFIMPTLRRERRRTILVEDNDQIYKNLPKFLKKNLMLSSTYGRIKSVEKSLDVKSFKENFILYRVKMIEDWKHECLQLIENPDYLCGLGFPKLVENFLNGHTEEEKDYSIPFSLVSLQNGGQIDIIPGETLFPASLGPSREICDRIEDLLRSNKVELRNVERGTSTLSILGDTDSIAYSRNEKTLKSIPYYPLSMQKIAATFHDHPLVALMDLSVRRSFFARITSCELEQSERNEFYERGFLIDKNAEIYNRTPQIEALITEIKVTSLSELFILRMFQKLKRKTVERIAKSPENWRFLLDILNEEIPDVRLEEGIDPLIYEKFPELQVNFALDEDENEIVTDDNLAFYIPDGIEIDLEYAQVDVYESESDSSLDIDLSYFE
jgi:hypothetical protein